MTLDEEKRESESVQKKRERMKKKHMNKVCLVKCV